MLKISTFDFVDYDDVQRRYEVEDYNPWGKPGCGAPLMSDTGDVINDYRRRKLNQSTDQVSAFEYALH